MERDFFSVLIRVFIDLRFLFKGNDEVKLRSRDRKNVYGFYIN